MRYRIHTTMISFVLLLFVQAAIAASPTNSSNQRQGSSQTQDGNQRRVQSGSPRRNSSEFTQISTKDYHCLIKVRDDYYEQVVTLIRVINEDRKNAQAFARDQKTSNDSVYALDDKIDNVQKSNRGIVIAICILGGIIALLIVLFIVILFLRTRKQKVSFKPLLDRIDQLENKLINEQKNSNAAKGAFPSIESITSGIVAKLEDRFQNLRKELSNNKVQVDISPIVKTLEQIKNDLLAENKKLKANEDSIAKQKSDLASAQAFTDAALKSCKQKEEELDKIISEKEEAIRLEVKNSEARKYEAERAKFEEERENLRSRADERAKRLDDAREENASLLAEKELAEKTGFQNGCASQIEKIENLSKALAELKQKYEQAQLDMAQLQEQEQQKFELRLSREKADAEDEIKQNFEAKVNDLITTLTAKETIITQREESLRQLSSEKSEIEKRSIAQEAEIIQLNETVAQKEKDVSEARNKVEKITSLLNEQKEANDSLQQKNEDLVSQCNNQESKIEDLTAKNADAELKIKELQKAIYPEVFISESDFAPLKAHLDDWLAKHIPGAEIVKSSLALFAQRDTLNSETWQLALRNISQGISTVLKSQNASVSAVIEELVQWSKFLMKYSDENFDFSLKIPNAGDAVDVSWMSPVNRKAIKVSQIVTWAVWHNQYGVRYNAEVE